MVKECKKCKRKWYYPIKSCIFCQKELTETNPTKYHVKGITEVFIPSTNHKQVPYFDLLLEDEHGDLHIKKTFETHKIGDTISSTKKEEKIEYKIAVIGTGIGVEIAQLAAQAGYEVVLKSRSITSLQKAKTKITTNLLKSLTQEETDEIISSITWTTNEKDITDSDMIIESILENLNKKNALFKRLDEICKKNTIFATNTSSLSITELASYTKRPEKFVGLHFFNPPTKMRLVEVVKGEKTNKKTFDYTVKFAEKINKTVLTVSDTPCFIVNRILMPYLNEAVIALEEGTSTPEEIDLAAKLGLNHPMGPLALIDLIGLDVFIEIMQNLHTRTKNDKYKPAKTALKLVKEGKLGRKTKEGFYKY